MKRRRVYSVLLSAVLSAGMAFGSIAAPAFAAETEAVSEDAQKGGIVEELRIGITKDIEPRSLASDVGRILRTFKIKKNVEVTDNGKIII